MKVYIFNVRERTRTEYTVTSISDIVPKTSPFITFGDIVFMVDYTFIGYDDRNGIRYRLYQETFVDYIERIF